MFEHNYALRRHRTRIQRDVLQFMHIDPIDMFIIDGQAAYAPFEILADLQRTSRRRIYKKITKLINKTV